MLPCIMAEEKLEKAEPPIFVIPSGITTCLFWLVHGVGGCHL